MMCSVIADSSTATKVLSEMHTGIVCTTIITMLVGDSWRSAYAFLGVF